jgi:hypothetical protein
MRVSAIRVSGLAPDPHLALSFEEEEPGTPDVLGTWLVEDADGSVIGFVAFGRDEGGTS